MNVGELRNKLSRIPDDVAIFIEDMENFSIQNFKVSTYYDGDSYVDFILPVYIKDFLYEIPKSTRVYNVSYDLENYQENFGIEQLLNFVEYRIAVSEDKKIQKYKGKKLTEKLCLKILKLDGYIVKISEIY